jgi:hypothetical protein
MPRSRRSHALLVLALSVPLFALGDRVLAIQDSEDKVWFGPVGNPDILPAGRGLDRRARYAAQGDAYYILSHSDRFSMCGPVDVQYSFE